MDITFSVRVVDDDGQPVEGAKVAVHYPWTHDHGYTNEDGWIEFEKNIMTANGVRTTIYVNGEEVDTPWVEDRDTFSFTRP